VEKRDVLIYVIWQNPRDSTTELTQRVLDKFGSKLAKIVILDKKHLTPEDNIDAARLETLTTAFWDPSIELAVILEDDVCIAKDSLDFVELIISLESKKLNFRGINLGSREEINSPYGYSRIRYGIHGPASAISRKTWEKSGLATAGLKQLPRTWDGYLEAYLKTGFMVTPNLSRYIDFGSGGTHSSSSNEDYFKGLQKSFSLLAKYEKSQQKYTALQSLQCG
jgi:GR25 family glycosyltransferase involved in LPS biosynthesis